MSSKRTCYHCKRAIRSNSKKAVYLFLRDSPRGIYEAWVCDKKCLAAYNDGEDVEEKS